MPARDDLKEQSYAQVEHGRYISIRRLQSERRAKSDIDEQNEVICRLHRLVVWSFGRLVVWLVVW